VSAGADEPARTGRGGRGGRGAGRVRRGGLARVVGWAVALVTAGAVGVALARWLGVRPPLARW
jgi:hypothetical protein